MSAGRVEGGADIPHYAWADRKYHLDGSDTSSSVLETRVFPALGRLSRLYPTLVADFGCGEGRIRARAPHWSGRPYIFRGYDRDEAAVRRYNTGDFKPDRAKVADLTTLDIAEDSFASAFLWRVLHTLHPEFHKPVLEKIVKTLKEEARLFVSARSDQDWVASFLKDRGLYREGEVNDYYPAMKEALDPLGITTWPSCFFRQGELARLGESVGLIAVHQELIKEQSGFEVLKRTRPPLTYDYVEFIKP